MANVWIRTVVLYILIVLLMRLTGKRQIGQLELTELVTAFMISELASYPISNNSIPLLYGVIPAVTLVCLEVFLSFASVKSRRFRKALTGNALALVKNGKVDEAQMTRARITLDELLSAARMAGVAQLSDVSYAFLEPCGTISVLPKAESMPPSAADLGRATNEVGVGHALILDGQIDSRELQSLGLGERWLLKTVRQNGYTSEKELFYMEINDRKELFFIRREKNVSSHK